MLFTLLTETSIWTEELSNSMADGLNKGLAQGFAIMAPYIILFAAISLGIGLLKRLFRKKK